MKLLHTQQNLKLCKERVTFPQQKIVQDQKFVGNQQSQISFQILQSTLIFYQQGQQYLFIKYQYYKYLNIHMKVLPPGLQSLSSHTFGQFSIHLCNLLINNNIQLAYYKPIFFGNASDDNTNLFDISQINKQKEKTQRYQIATNLWLFYSYLSDMQNLTISFYNQNKILICTSRLPISLKNVRSIMTPQCKYSNIINQQQFKKISIIDDNSDIVGSICIKLQTEFDMKILQDIKDIIDFNSMVVFQGISPICSQNQLPRQPPQQLLYHQQQQKNNKNTIINKQNEEELKKNFNNLNQLQVQFKENLSQQRMIQQDIDKLIQQLQSKPYDSSRYQQNKQQLHQYSITNKEKTFNNYSSCYEMFNNHKNYSHEYDGSCNFYQTQVSLKRQSIPMSRPPSQTQYIKPQFSQKKQMINSSLSNNIYKITTNEQILATPAKQSQIPSQGSHIQLKIHEMQFSYSNKVPQNKINQLIHQNYTLKIYQNKDTQQYFIGQGIKQGQIIKFNLQLKIRNIKYLQHLKFTICDDYGYIQCQGIFDLSRLFTSHNQKGVFIVSLLTNTTNNPLNKIKQQEDKLVQVFPLARSLRIEAQLVERVQMVQIFMKIFKVSLDFNVLRYKIPLTKQTIQHLGNTHINIFPHSISSHNPDKILLQFWKNEQNIGQSQISLKNIKNININTLNANIQPIYLYDGKKQIKNILDGDKIVGNFYILLCFGTVKQIQSLLLTTIDQQKTVIKQQNSKVHVQFDQRLGVIVKQKPTQVNQVSVQVQPEHLQNHSNILQQSKNLLSKLQQPQFGEQSIISQNSANQFLQASLMSFAQTSQPPPTPSKLPPTQTLQKKPPPSLPTLTQKIIETICELLSQLPPKLKTIKQQCKPYLLFNFIDANIFKNILANLGCSNHTIILIFKFVLFVKQDMININVLYDLCLCIQIDQCIKPHLINDEMLIAGAMRLLYKNEQLRQTILLQNDMQFRQMSQIFQKIGLKLTLHQYKTLQKYMQKYKTKKDAQSLKQTIIAELQNQTVQKMQQVFYEQDILKQIYGQDSSVNNSNVSFNDQQIKNFGTIATNNTVHFNKTIAKESKIINTEKPIPKTKQLITKQLTTKQLITKQLTTKQLATTKSPKQSKQKKQYKYTISLDGTQNVKDSAQCVLDTLPSNTYFRIIIDNPIFQQLIFSSQKNKQFIVDNQIKDIDGRVQFVGTNLVLACSAFSLIHGIQSLYPMKTKQGHFCGLLKIKVQ